MNHTGHLNFTEADLATSIPARFYQVLQQLPADYLAYVGPDGSLTYQEFAAASQGLAVALLAHLGQATEPSQQQAVALFLPHQSSALIGIWGTLLAGHFYVPLELSLGKTMVQQILADCPPQAVVTTTGLSEEIKALLPAEYNLPILCIDTIPWAESPLPLPPPCPSQLYASVQYTSGSTGKPRGVIRTHATMLYTSYLGYHDLGVRCDTRMSHLSSYTHTFSGPSIFGGLLNGSTLHTQMVTSLNPLSLYHWIEDQQITTLNVSIGLLRGLADLAPTHLPLLSLRSIGTGGEVMMRPEVERLCQLLPDTCKLVVRLASTEAGSYARFIIEVGKPWQGDRTPAGYVPYGQEVLILDEQREPVDAGQAGEIAVRSPFLCAGYWNRPAENAAKFLPSPTPGEPPLFLTGDRGRISADGIVEHLGRIDFMVKIRGFRVEPEAIEQVLMDHTALYECAVVARPRRSGEARLIAYLVARSAPAPSPRDLRAFLAQSLPDYMIPARFVLMESLPRNANGKLQRQALPTPGVARPDLSTPFVAARTEAEQQLADMWGELLEIDEVGIEDDFFELGGDSLTAMRLIVLLEQQMGFAVPITFFQAPTLTNLAALLSTEVMEEPVSTVAPPRHSPPVTEEGPARWADALYGKGNGVGARVRRQVLLRGPVAKGVALPYAIGNRIQRTWLRQMGQHSQLFAPQRAIFQYCCAEAGLRDPQAELLTTNLMVNTWVAWRSKALTSSAGIANWVTLKGYERFQAALAQQKGIIIVFAHQRYSGALAKYLLRQNGIEQHYVVSNSSNIPDADHLPLIERTQRAHSTLKNRSALLIAGEGRMGARAITVPFYGRSLSLPAGFAELAFLNQAPALAVFVTMSADGRLALEFAELPTPSQEAEIRDSVYLYSQMLTERWPQLLPTMGWGRLKYITSLPTHE